MGHLEALCPNGSWSAKKKVDAQAGPSSATVSSVPPPPNTADSPLPAQAFQSPLTSNAKDSLARKLTSSSVEPLVATVGI